LLGTSRINRYWISENRRGSASLIVSPWICEAGINLESLRPIATAGRLRKKLVKGPAIPVSKRALREGIGPSIRMIAPSVPKGEMRGRGRKKGSVALIPLLRDMK
jgi:hypothetical protein